MTVEPIESAVIVPQDPAPTRRERLAMRFVQAGAIATVLSATILRAFELDRFFVPKEIALHLCVTLAALLMLGTIARSIRSRVDILLAGYFIWSTVSALLATNRWIALRALAITASGILLFWIGRRLREVGLDRVVLRTLAFAVVLAAMTSLVEAYGLDLEVFARSRVPGGLLGNRNFVAHACAFGLPLLLLATLRARRSMAFLMGAIGIALTTATLALTRSRAAWLAFAAVAVVFLLSMIFSPALRRSGRTWMRVLIVLAVAAGGIAAAVTLPNTLRWNSDNPYLDTAKRVADFQEGSGHGRLVQYERSAMMSLYHPFLGVGPGNWPVVYPKHAAKHDPSLDDKEPGTTSNPWPSSDWVASISERSVLATACIAFVFASLFFSGLRALFTSTDTEHALLAMALLGTSIGAVVTGLFDAVLLLAMPTMIVWTALGALAPTEPVTTKPSWRFVAMAIVLVAATGAVRSAMQLTAMQIYSTTSDHASLQRAARLDPGNYRLQLCLARMGKKQDRCEHALAALGLFPNAEAAKSAARGCR